MRRLVNIGDRVVTDIGVAGRVINIRFDSNFERLITVELDRSVTPDGLYIVRDFELMEKV